MRKLQPFPRPGERHGMIANDIATADRMDADLVRRPFADQTFASVSHIFPVIELPNFAQNLRQLFRGPARRIFFKAMMDLRDFEIEISPEHFRRFSGEPK